MFNFNLEMCFYCSGRFGFMRNLCLADATLVWRVLITVYFREENYALIGISQFLVSRTAQKLIKKFSQNSVERRHMGQGIND